MLKYADDLIPSLALEKPPQQEMDYLLAISTSFLSSILMVWVKHGKSEPVDEVCQIYTKMMAALLGARCDILFKRLPVKQASPLYKQKSAGEPPKTGRLPGGIRL